MVLLCQKWVCTGRTEGFELGPVIQRMLQVPGQTPQCSQVLGQESGGVTEGQDGPHIPKLDVPRQKCHAGQSKSNLPAPAGCPGARYSGVWPKVNPIINPLHRRMENVQIHSSPTAQEVSEDGCKDLSLLDPPTCLPEFAF